MLYHIISQTDPTLFAYSKPHTDFNQPSNDRSNHFNSANDINQQFIPLVELGILKLSEINTPSNSSSLSNYNNNNNNNNNNNSSDFNESHSRLAFYGFSSLNLSEEIYNSISIERKQLIHLAIARSYFIPMDSDKYNDKNIATSITPTATTNNNNEFYLEDDAEKFIEKNAFQLLINI